MQLSFSLRVGGGNKHALCVLCCLLFLPGVPWAIPVNTSLSLASSLQVSDKTSIDQGFSVQANNKRLSKVLDAISSKTGIPVHYAWLPAALLTVHCQGAGIKALLLCLLGDRAGIVYRYQDNTVDEHQGNRIKEVWILGLNRLEIQENPNGPEDSNDQQIMPKHTELVADATDELLVEAQQPHLKALAIARLANEGRLHDTRVKQTLKQAITDQNPEVRAQAVFALAKREGEAAATELKLALHDSNAEVRMMVVENLSNDSSLLEDAMRDADSAISQLAYRKLQLLHKSKHL